MKPRDLPEQFPSGLSGNPRKPYYYGREIYFREAWHEFSAGLASRPSDLFRQHTFVLFKPDGVMARAPGRALPVMAARGFQPRGAFVIRFDRLMTRELWRYELNRAALGRMAVVDKLLELGPSLLLLVRDVDPSRGDLSAAERLTAWKGSSRAELGEDSLRGAIGASRGLLNFIHTPDDTADVIRELGVLLTREQRARAASLLAGEDEDEDAITAAVAECGAALPEGPTTWPTLVRELERLAKAHFERVPADLARLFRQAQISDVGDCRALLDACAAAGAPAPTTIAVLLEACCVVSDLPDIVPIFDYVDPADF